MLNEIHGPDGLTLRIVDDAPGALEMEAAYSEAAVMPPEHLHPRQDERFEVLEGAVRAIVGGAERRYESGESFSVPAGTPHRMAAEAATRLRWEVRPALRTAEFFERLYSGEITDFPAFFEEFREEIRLG